MIANSSDYALVGDACFNIQHFPFHDPGSSHSSGFDYALSDSAYCSGYWEGG